MTLLAFLDLLADFTTVDHSIIQQHLREVRVEDTELQWFCSYLQNCLQKGCCCSTPCEMSRDVPQGSILSAVLFNIYMKTLGAVIRFGLKSHQYADDTQTCLSAPS